MHGRLRIREWRVGQRFEAERDPRVLGRGRDHRRMRPGEAVPVERCRDRREITVQHDILGGAGHPTDQPRIAPGQHRRGELVVVVRVVEARGRGVRRRVGGRKDQRVGIDNADVTACLGAQHGHRAGMREQLMVRGLKRAAEQRETGRVDADRVAEGGVQGRLVDGGPVADAIAQRAGREKRVVRESFGGVPEQPATLLHECQGHVPVVQGSPRLDPGREQRVDQPVVVAEPRSVRGSGPTGLHARPGQRESVRVNAEFAEQRDIVRPPVYLIGGHVRRAAVCDPTRQGREDIPDRRLSCRGCRRRPRPGSPRSSHRTRATPPAQSPGRRTCSSAAPRSASWFQPPCGRSTASAHAENERSMSPVAELAGSSASVGSAVGSPARSAVCGPGSDVVAELGDAGEILRGGRHRRRVPDHQHGACFGWRVGEDLDDVVDARPVQLLEVLHRRTQSHGGPGLPRALGRRTQHDVDRREMCGEPGASSGRVRRSGVGERSVMVGDPRPGVRSRTAWRGQQDQRAQGRTEAAGSGMRRTCGRARVGRVRPTLGQRAARRPPHGRPRRRVPARQPPVRRAGRGSHGQRHRAAVHGRRRSSGLHPRRRHLCPAAGRRRPGRPARGGAVGDGELARCGGFPWCGTGGWWGCWRSRTSRWPPTRSTWARLCAAYRWCPVGSDGRSRHPMRGRRPVRWPCLEKSDVPFCLLTAHELSLRQHIV